MPRLLKLLLLLLLPTLVAAQGSYVGSTPPAIKTSTIGVTPTLQAIPFASITVCAAADPNIPCTTKVNIFKDAALTQPLQNPFPADINGNYTFAVAAGNYTVTITGSGVNGFSYQVSAGGGGSSNAISLNSVPFCTGFTPTNNQFLQYTTALSPNPCYTAATNVTSLNSLTGSVGLTAGSNITLTPSGNNIQIASTGGGGGTPAGAQFDVQCNNTVFSNCAGATENIKGDLITTGPNPTIDIRAFNGRAVNPGVPPQTTGFGATCTVGSNVVTLSAAWPGQNGDYVNIWNCGPVTVTTPAAPTVTPVTAAGPTMSQLTAPAPTGGSSYCYQILGRTFLGGTSVSGETCTSTGPASLGTQSVSISSITLSNNLATYTTSSAHGIQVGTYVRITGAFSTDFFGGQSFNGWFLVNSVPDNTHFTVYLPYDSRAGAPVASSGNGTVTWWNGVKITAAASTNNYEYYVYGRVAGGSKTLIGIMQPQPFGTTCAGLFPFGDNGTCLTFTDFGSGGVLTAAPTVPIYIPATVPGAGSTQDMLLAQIISGAGTTSLTLSANASANNTSVILFDDAQALVAAWNASASSQGPITIPSSPPGTQWVFNAPIKIVNQGGQRPVIQQAGNVTLNEPIVFQTFTKWQGVPGGGQTAPGFSQQVQPTITVNRASPGMYVTGANSMYMENINYFLAGAASQIGFLQDAGGNPTSKFTNVTFNTAPSHSNTAIMLRAAGANSQFVSSSMLGSQNGSYADSTPIAIINQGGNVKIDWLYMSGAGILFIPDGQGAGEYLDAKDVYCQACYMPFFSVARGAGGQPFWGKINNIINDTPFDNQIFSNFGGNPLNLQSTGGALASGYVSSTGNSGGTVNTNNVDNTGNGFPIVNSPTPGGMEDHGQSQLMRDGVFGTVQLPMDSFARKMKLVPGFGLYSDAAAYAAPTCTPAAGGTLAAGTYLVNYAPQFAATGDEGHFSQSCAVVLSGGNGTINATAPAAVPGVTSAGYNWYYQPPSSNPTLCQLSAGLSISITAVGSCSGGPYSYAPAGGPAGIKNSELWGQQLYLGLSNITSSATATRAVGIPDAAGSVPISTNSPLAALTGQTLTATNGAAAAFTSPGTADGNGGTAVTTTPYTVQCDSATSLLDRATVVPFGTGSSVVTVPSSTAAGCTGHFRFSGVNQTTSTLTWNRSNTDTFNVYNGNNATTGATSFTLGPGQFVDLNQGATGIWEVKITGNTNGTGGTIDPASPVMAYYFSNACPVQNTGQCYFTPANTQLANDCTWSTGSTTVTCATSHFVSGDVGKRVAGYFKTDSFGTTFGCVAGRISFSSLTTGVVTISSFTSGTQIALSVAPANNATSNHGCLVWGTPDDSNAVSFEAVYAAVSSFCPKVMLSAAGYWFSDPHFYTQPTGCTALPSLGVGSTFGAQVYTAGFELEGRGPGNTVIFLGPDFPATNTCSQAQGSITGACFLVPVEGKFSDFQISGGAQLACQVPGNKNLLGVTVGTLQNITLTNFCQNASGGQVGIKADLLSQLYQVNNSGFGAVCLQTVANQPYVQAFKLACENSPGSLANTNAVEILADGGTTPTFNCFGCLLLGAISSGNMNVVSVGAGATVRLIGSTVANCEAGSGCVTTATALFKNNGGNLYLDNVSGIASGGAALVGGINCAAANSNNYVRNSTLQNIGNANYGGNNAGCTLYDLGGNGPLFTGVAALLGNVVADGKSFRGICTGTATSSATLGLYGTGPNETLTTCTSTTIGSGIPMTQPRTIAGLMVTATHAGFNASSGVVTVLKNGVATTTTCTIGTGTSCVDFAHNPAFSAGDLLSIQFTTQATEVLAGVQAQVIWQ